MTESVLKTLIICVTIAFCIFFISNASSKRDSKSDKDETDKKPKGD